MRRQLVSVLAVLVATPLCGASAEERFGLKIEPEAGEATYNRDLYDHWIDVDGDRMTTRHEVLAAESLVPATVDADGEVVSGLWVGSYTGFVTTEPGTLDVDHMIPIKEAHLSGAHAWDAPRRRDFANDLGHPKALIAVKAGANRSKLDRDPAEWMPPNRSYWCQYLADWIAIKRRWDLSVDPAEADAIGEGFRACERYASGDSLEGRH